jgi:ABC-type antimicrobial peptide transport system permease subunit
LAFGIEDTAINQITKDINLFTIEAQPIEFEKKLSFQDFSSFTKDKRINQIVPVLTEFADLKLYKKNAQDNSDNLEQEIASLSVYTESYFTGGDTGKDLRTNSLKFIRGTEISKSTPNGIIISKNVFDQIASENPTINLDNYDKQIVKLTVKRSDKQILSFPCTIVGISERTAYNSALVYVALPLAAKIDDWQNSRNDTSINYQNRDYERFDLVTNNLDDLESVRQDLRNKGFSTRSVLDEIDEVRSVIGVVRFIFFLIIFISVLISAFNIIITLTSYVLKRQKEIGILKSLGATDVQIQYIFILHAIYLCLIGSALGSMTAYSLISLSQVILSKFENFKDVNLFKFSLLNILAVVFTSVLLGVLASLIPARKAASITPIETIRSS